MQDPVDVDDGLGGQAPSIASACLLQLVVEPVQGCGSELLQGRRADARDDVSRQVAAVRGPCAEAHLAAMTTAGMTLLGLPRRQPVVDQVGLQRQPARLDVAALVE